MTSNTSTHPEDHLQNLRTFMAVAQAQSVARAAEILFKAPSAISRSIAELELFVGATLFERRPRGMLVNGYGDAVLARARRIQTEVQQAVDEYLRSLENRSPSAQSAVHNLMFSGRKLKLLIHLGNVRNISSAAEYMDMSQAGASMALSRIEASIGQPLFQRMMQGMIPTDAAARLILRARRIFSELRHMGSDIAALSGVVGGSVVIGTTLIGGTYYVPTAIAAVTARYPGLRVSTVESPYEQLIDKLRGGDVDLVFGALRPPESCEGLSTEALFKDRVCVVARAGHRLADGRHLQIADLVAERWILPRANASARRVVDAAFESFGQSAPAPSVETADLAIIRQLLNVSDMLTVVSPHQLMFEIRSGSVVRLPVDLGAMPRAIGLTVREESMLSPAGIKMLEALRAQVGEDDVAALAEMALAPRRPSNDGPYDY